MPRPQRGGGRRRVVSARLPDDKADLFQSFADPAGEMERWLDGVAASPSPNLDLAEEALLQSLELSRRRAELMILLAQQAKDREREAQARTWLERLTPPAPVTNEFSQWVLGTLREKAGE